ncbi:MAG: ATP-dependent zinc metalloprotease FtsH [Lachnospiraceae bacterium]|nr:ATP-dependent zinc metalloprotease FtsH [Lachnospiraceae bacterium]
MEGNSNNKKGGNENDRKKGTIVRIISTVIVFFLFIGGYIILRDYTDSLKHKEITYNEFIQMVEEGNVKEVELQTDYDRIVITPITVKEEDRMVESYYTGIVGDDDLPDYLLEHNIKFKRKIVDKSTTLIDFLIAYILPFALIYLMMWAVFRAISKNGGIGGVGGVGKSRAKMYVENETGVTFKDVAGQEEAKDSVMELVDFLHDPAKYTRIGAKLPKGALLVGPPGTGKTLLAKAVAGEAHVPFFSLSGSDFVEMFVGVGASRVRDLFKQAQSAAPCIIFIDEIDAIGKSRDSRYGGGNDEREQTLNQLLAEMDGFDTSKGIVILAATNRPEVLDKALLRPGRFDRRIIVDKPDLKGRLAVLKVHAKNVLMHDSVNLEEIALATSGAVGSDLANIINEAAILAVKEGRTVVKQSDLMESVEVVFAGKEKKDRILGPEEKKIVAFHEVGHALIACLEKNAEPVQKITIVPRTMGALGYTMQVPEEEKYLESKEEILTMIRTFCGGRAAEEITFGSITTGASNDIERATKLARQMITLYGMSDEFGMVALESIESQYLDGRSVLNCSDETAAKVDEAVRRVMKESYEKAKQMLSENREILEKAAAFLIEKETITGKQFMEIFRSVKEPVKNEETAADAGDAAASDTAAADEKAVTDTATAYTEGQPGEGI